MSSSSTVTRLLPIRRELGSLCLDYLEKWESFAIALRWDTRLIVRGANPQEAANDAAMAGKFEYLDYIIDNTAGTRIEHVILAILPSNTTNASSLLKKHYNIYTRRRRACQIEPFGPFRVPDWTGLDVLINSLICDKCDYLAMMGVKFSISHLKTAIESGNYDTYDHVCANLSRPAGYTDLQIFAEALRDIAPKSYDIYIYRNIHNRVCRNMRDNRIFLSLFIASLRDRQFEITRWCTLHISIPARLEEIIKSAPLDLVTYYWPIDLYFGECRDKTIEYIVKYQRSDIVCSFLPKFEYIIHQWILHAYTYKDSPNRGIVSKLSKAIPINWTETLRWTIRNIEDDGLYVNLGTIWPKIQAACHRGADPSVLRELVWPPFWQGSSGIISLVHYGCVPPREHFDEFEESDDTPDDYKWYVRRCPQTWRTLLRYHCRAGFRALVRTVLIRSYALK